MRSDRTYMALVGTYREVYSRLGEEFSEIDKTDNLGTQVQQILEHLGYEVELTETYNGESY